jgi:hypothetical protein
MITAFTLIRYYSFYTESTDRLVFGLKRIVAVHCTFITNYSWDLVLERSRAIVELFAINNKAL